MKKYIYFSAAGLLVIGAFVVLDAYRNELFWESYMATMRRQTGMAATEMRADEYRRSLEICDEFHNCTRITPRALNPGGTVHEGENKANAEKPLFVFAPVWL